MEWTAVPVTLTLELRAEGADIGSLERAVSAGLEETARRLWSELLTALEAALSVYGSGDTGAGVSAPWVVAQMTSASRMLKGDPRKPPDPSVRSTYAMG